VVREHRDAVVHVSARLAVGEPVAAKKEAGTCSEKVSRRYGWQAFSCLMFWLPSIVRTRYHVQ
jgi:hypothetical protein